LKLKVGHRHEFLSASMNMAVYSKPLNLHSVGCEVWIAGGTISSSFPHPHALISFKICVCNKSKAVHPFYSSTNSGACSTSCVNSGACSMVPVRPVQFKAKNTLNQILSNKIQNIFFIFNCILFKKLVLNII